MQSHRRRNADFLATESPAPETDDEMIHNLGIEVARHQTGRRMFYESRIRERIQRTFIGCWFTIFFAVGFPASAQAQRSVGWPHIRGPNYDGVSSETELADSWPDAGPPVLWTRELGQGYSSIVASNDRVYTQYQSLGGQFVLCLDATNGQTVWSHRYDWSFESTGLYPGPYSTPSIAEDHLYFTTPLGSVHCLTLDGDPVWRRDLKTEFDGQGTDFGYACSATIVDGKVILPVGGRHASLVALDAKNGELIWTSGNEPASYVPVLPVTFNGHQMLVAYLQHDLVGCELATGKQLWKQTLSHGYDEHSAWPIYREPRLWTSAPFQAGSQMWTLTGDGEHGCERVLDSQVMSNDVASSVLVGDTIYGFDLSEAQSKAHRPSRGSFRAIDWRTGDQRWSNGDASVRRPLDFETNRLGQIVGHASILAADGKLFLLNDLGDLILTEANSEQYVELGRTRVLGGQIGWSSPALDQGRLFVRNQTRIVCLFVGNPNRSDAPRRDRVMSVADVPQGSLRDYTRLIGVEPQYAMDPPTWRWLVNWYASSALILLSAAVVVMLLRLGLGERLTVADSRRVFCWVVFSLGVVVGAPVSLLQHDFVFTWPTSLFIAFTAAFHSSKLRRGANADSTSQSAWPSRMVAAGFLVSSAAYFIACRRLSLVTQWTFLCGFPAAIPLLALDRYWITRQSTARRNDWLRLGVSLLLTQLAFTAYFAMTAALLATKYQLSQR